MRRIFLVLVVLALLVTTAMPAMAQGGQDNWGSQGNHWANNWDNDRNDNWDNHRNDNWWDNRNNNISCSWFPNFWWGHFWGWSLWCWSPWWGWWQS